MTPHARRILADLASLPRDVARCYDTPETVQAVRSLEQAGLVIVEPTPAEATARNLAHAIARLTAPGRAAAKQE